MTIPQCNIGDIYLISFSCDLPICGMIPVSHRFNNKLVNNHYLFCIGSGYEPGFHKEIYWFLDQDGTKVFLPQTWCLAYLENVTNC